MNNGKQLITIGISAILSGCAHIDFGGDGLTYYDPKPYLFVSTTKDCVTVASVIVLPETKKVMKFKSGYGSADLSTSISNGMISSVGQKTDTKIPETLSAIASLGTAAGGIKPMVEPTRQVICTPTATLYPIASGIPDLTHPVSFPVSKETVHFSEQGNSNQRR